MNRNNQFPGRDVRGNNVLDTLIGIVVLICLIIPEHQEEP